MDAVVGVAAARRKEVPASGATAVAASVTGVGAPLIGVLAAIRDDAIAPAGRAPRGGPGGEDFSEEVFRGLVETTLSRVIFRNMTSEDRTDEAQARTGRAGDEPGGEDRAGGDRAGGDRAGGDRAGEDLVAGGEAGRGQAGGD